MVNAKVSNSLSNSLLLKLETSQDTRGVRYEEKNEKKYIKNMKFMVYTVRVHWVWYIENNKC